jgi:putative tricarboxylic transport membrane protein
LSAVFTGKIGMRKKEAIGSSFWIALGLLFSAGAFRYGLFEEGVPGPGLLPLIAGIILISLGVGVLIPALKKEAKPKPAEKGFFPEKDSFKKLLLAVVALGVYGMALEYMGFLIMTFLFMIFLLRFIEPQKWTVVLTTSLLTAASSYLLFQLLLKVQLPKGIWGI